MGITFVTIGQVAREVGMSRWRLAYLIERGELPPPSAEVPGRRLFSPEDVEKIKHALEAMEEGTGSHQLSRGGQTSND